MDSFAKVDEPFPTPPLYFLPGKTLSTCLAKMTRVNGFVSNFSFCFQMNVQRGKMPECTIFTHRLALRHLLHPSPFHLELPAPPKINCPYQVLASLTCLPPFQTCSRTLDVTYLLKTEYHFFNYIQLSVTAVLQLGAVDWKDVCLLALHGISRLVLQPLKQFGHNQIKCVLVDCKRNLTWCHFLKLSLLSLFIVPHCFFRVRPPFGDSQAKICEL